MPCRSRFFVPLLLSMSVVSTTGAVTAESAAPGAGAVRGAAHDSRGSVTRDPVRAQRPADGSSNPKSWINLKLLAFNDFHGQLQPRVVSGRPAGGAAVLASYLKSASADSPHGAIIVHAGDQVGASPPVSALLQDEPSITLLNLLANDDCRLAHGAASNKKKISAGHSASQRSAGFNPDCNLVGTVGNHEFDEGFDEMLRLVNGGIHADGPFLDPDYDGIHFPYVAANVVYKDTGQPVLPPYVVKRLAGQRIAFIGAVLRATPTIVTPGGVTAIEFLDEATAINRYVPELQEQGVRAIVVAIHQGTGQTSYSGPTRLDPVDIGGELGAVVRELDDEIDIVVSGHSHQFTNAFVPNRNGTAILVTQAFSASTAYADIDIAIDPASNDIVYKSAEIVTTWADEGPGLTPDPAVASLVDQASARVEPVVARVVGIASVDITATETAAGESALGNLIADAQRAAAGTDIAFVNPGGIRTDVAAGAVTWGELFTVQPFRDDVVRLELSGAQIVALLHEQWDGQPFPRILKPSGISYDWNPAAPANDRINVAGIRINGAPIGLDRIYSVAVNSFLAAGGDNFTGFTYGANRVIGPADLDALVNYIQNLAQPFSAAIEGRIRLAP